MGALFRDGLDDPKLSLRRVDISDAEYWDSSGRGLGFSLNWLKGGSAGSKLDPGGGEKMQL